MVTEVRFGTLMPGQTRFGMEGYPDRGRKESGESDTPWSCTRDVFSAPEPQSVLGRDVSVDTANVRSSESKE